MPPAHMLFTACAAAASAAELQAVQELFFDRQHVQWAVLDASIMRQLVTVCVRPVLMLLASTGEQQMAGSMASAEA